MPPRYLTRASTPGRLTRRLGYIVARDWGQTRGSAQAAPLGRDVGAHTSHLGNVVVMDVWDAEHLQGNLGDPCQSIICDFLRKEREKIAIGRFEVVHVLIRYSLAVKMPLALERLPGSTRTARICNDYQRLRLLVPLDPYTRRDHLPQLIRRNLDIYVSTRGSTIETRISMDE